MILTKAFIGILVLLSFRSADLSAKHHELFGAVVEKGSGKPVKAVYVFIVRGEEEASTDAKGEFKFRSWQNLPLILHVQSEEKELRFTITNPEEKIIIRI